jgi:thiaminase/transcriptional activator TenA
VDRHLGSAEFAQVVAEALALADRIGPRLGGDDEARGRRHFTVTARYEWMFWTPPGGWSVGR